MGMINLDAGFDPYKDYTNILKKSAHITTKESEVQKKPDIDVDKITPSMSSEKAIESLRNEIPRVDLSDVRNSLKGIQDFSFVGRDSDVKKLDANKAVSDMQKDDILMEYQYFVGSAVENEPFTDGLVIEK